MMQNFVLNAKEGEADYKQLYLDRTSIEERYLAMMKKFGIEKTEFTSKEIDLLNDLNAVENEAAEIRIKDKKDEIETSKVLYELGKINLQNYLNDLKKISKSFQEELAKEQGVPLIKLDYEKLPIESKKALVLMQKAISKAEDDLTEAIEDAAEDRIKAKKNELKRFELLYETEKITIAEYLNEVKRINTDFRNELGKEQEGGIFNEETLSVEQKKALIMLEKLFDKVQKKLDEELVLEFKADIKTEGLDVSDVLDKFDALEHKSKGSIDAMVKETERLSDKELQEALKEAYKLPVGDDRDRAILQAEINTLEWKIKVQEAVATSARGMLEVTDLSTESEVEAKEVINESVDAVARLGNEIDALKEKRDKIGPTFAEQFKGILRGIDQVTNELGKAASAWYSVVAQSVDKQVEKWLQGKI
jgi:hypothetical protein